MSKYIKLEDALNVYRLKPIIKNGTTTGVGYPTPEEIIYELSYLPTIEVSEDKVNAVNGIVAKPSDWNDLLVPKVSEDCISREWVKGICENMLDEEMLGHMLGYIEDAPSVVPSRAEGEWKRKQKKGVMTTQTEYHCSLCGTIMGAQWNYCPNCGAKMKG